jgi:hypothetical protein
MKTHGRLEDKTIITFNLPLVRPTLFTPAQCFGNEENIAHHPRLQATLVKGNF